MSLHVTYSELTKQEKLQLWMRRAGLTYAELGRKLGLTRAAAARLCKKETAPTRRVTVLKEIGIPADLLPIPLDITPGRKPKHQKS